MNAHELDTLLAEMLTDRKLSGSEKDRLTAWVLKNLDSDSDRGAARRQAFEAAAAQVAPGEVQRVLVWLEEVLKVLQGNAPRAAAPPSAHFSPGPDCLAQIVSRLQNAKQSVDICVFTITDDRITQPILAAHRRGVKVRIITDNDKANDFGSDIDQFFRAGVAVKTDHTAFHMHHKFAILDGARLLNGSYNWTRSAAEVNEENLIDTGDAGLIRAFQAEFDSLWATL
jgi:mitochondrial cardiolipin hydrolase